MENKENNKKEVYAVKTFTDMEYFDADTASVNCGDLLLYKDGKLVAAFPKSSWRRCFLSQERDMCPISLVTAFKLTDADVLSQQEEKPYDIMANL